MLDERLTQVLTRKMSAGDFCYQRFFSYMPLLQKEYCLYMIENHIYDSALVTCEIVKDWCNERIKDMKSMDSYPKKLNNAIAEIRYFYNVLCIMYDDFNGETFKSNEDYQQLVKSISLKDYLEVVRICKPYHDRLDSKLEHRLLNFKTKFNAVLKGRLKPIFFYQNEILDQKSNLELLLSRIDEFGYEQLPIFVISYDLRRLANSSTKVYNNR